MLTATRPPAPIRVTHLVANLQMGGLERVVEDFARYHDRDRVRMSVVCLEDMGPIADRIAGLGVPVSCLETAGKSLARSVFRVWRMLRAAQTDVLHTHNVKAHVQGGLAARLARVPVLINTKHGQHWPETRLARLASWFVNNRTCMVAVSRDTADVARRCEPIDPLSVRVVRNGIDTRQFSPTACAERRSTRAITVARLMPIKDQMTLLRAVKQVVAARPDFHLDIVGDGPLRDALVSAASELGVTGHVHFHGLRDDIAECLSRAGVFVLSSLSEGIPLTVLEAMSAGLPVVATDVGGLRDVVEDHHTGLLVPSADPDRLADALLTIISDPNLAYRMGSHGRTKAVAQFDIRRVVAEYERIYIRSLARRVRPPAAVGDRLSPLA